MSAVLGLDLGTSSAKAVVIDTEGHGDGHAEIENGHGHEALGGGHGELGDGHGESVGASSGPAGQLPAGDASDEPDDSSGA